MSVYVCVRVPPCVCCVLCMLHEAYTSMQRDVYAFTTRSRLADDQPLITNPHPIHPLPHSQEYCHGGPLTDLLYNPDKTGHPLTEPTVRFLCRHIVDGLLHMHRARIYHRDLKVENILLNASYEPQVADFGRTKLLMPTLPADGKGGGGGGGRGRKGGVSFGGGIGIGVCGGGGGSSSGVGGSVGGVVGFAVGGGSVGGSSGVGFALGIDVTGDGGRSSSGIYPADLRVQSTVVNECTMPPEASAVDEVTGRSAPIDASTWDTWSLGVVLMELCAVDLFTNGSLRRAQMARTRPEGALRVAGPSGRGLRRRPSQERAPVGGKSMPFPADLDLLDAVVGVAAGGAVAGAGYTEAVERGGGGKRRRSGVIEGEKGDGANGEEGEVGDGGNGERGANVGDGARMGSVEGTGRGVGGAAIPMARANSTTASYAGHRRLWSSPVYDDIAARISPTLRDLLNRIFQLDASARMDIWDIHCHPFCRARTGEGAAAAEAAEAAAAVADLKERRWRLGHIKKPKDPL